MKLSHLFLGSALAVGCISSLVRADTVITFDDINTGFGVAPIPNGYDGLTWSADWEAWYSQGDVYYPPDSNPNVAYVTDNSTATIGFPTPTTVNGFWWAGWSYDDTVTAYDSSDNVIDSLTYTSYSPNTNSSEWVTLDWSGVSQLDFSSDGGQRYFIIDNLTIGGSVGSVPDTTPAVALLALGLGGMLVMRRRARV